MPQSAPPWPTKAGASCARTITYSTSPAGTTSRRPASASSPVGSLAAASTRIGVAEQRALGNGYAHGARRHAHAGRHHAGLARLAEDLLEALEREGKAAGSETRTPEVVEDRVVAPARGEARCDTLRVALEDDAGVVVERVDDREVKGEPALLEEVGERVGEARELGGSARGPLHAGLGEKGVETGDDLSAAPEPRHLAQGARCRGGELGRGRDQLVERDEVGVVNELAHALREGLGGRAGVEQGRERHGRAEDDAPRRHLERAQDLGEQAHDLDLRRRPILGHELDAELRELPRLTAQARLLAHDGSAVAEARGKLACSHAARHEARHGKREVGRSMSRVPSSSKSWKAESLMRPARSRVRRSSMSGVSTGR